MSRPSAVIFDLDGTLTDTELTWDVVRRRLAEEDGRPWPPEATAAMMGLSTREWSSYLIDRVGLRGTADDAARRTIDGVAAHYIDHLEVLPGAVEAVGRLAERWPLGLASSSPRRLIDLMLGLMGIADLFTVTRSTEEGAGRGKPAPDAYLWVCDHLGVQPSAAVGVEDSTNGIRSVLAAGMRLVAIPAHFHPPGEEVLGQADAVLDNLDQLTVELVSEILDRDRSPSR